ncbi:outer membrane protein OmpA [Indibacter alkaliphilus LW1]|uniref:Outer membrane protein OmpA n=2 Tax=Indibacter TaxID=647744 RepID=S2E3G5_INDAL|nr:outer membrane protein OmpA [Indibacter alkaliphilus LW1]
MSDRYIQRDGRLMLENPNFFRSLNFQNHTRDMGLSFVFKTDNDRLLSSKSLIAPYFTLGFGLINFEVFGDLLDDEGNRYDYTLPIPVNNFEYETDLQPIRTEQESGYSLGSLYTNLGLGFRIRLSNRLELFAQSDFLYTFTDYLDDVSGNYRTNYENDFQAYAANPSGMVLDPNNLQRGNPNSPNDWIIFHSIGLKYNFGASKKTFSAPRISSYNPEYTVSAQSQKTAIPEEKEEESIESQTTSNYYNIQIIDDKRLDSLEHKSQILIWEQQILNRENRILAGQVAQKDLIGLRSQFLIHLQSLQKEQNLELKEKESMLDSSMLRLDNLRYSIDSISRREKELLLEIDSIRNLISTKSLPSQARSISTDSLDLFIQERIHSPSDTSSILEKKESDAVSGAETLEGEQPETKLRTEQSQRENLIENKESKISSSESVISHEEAATSTSTDENARIRRLENQVDYLIYQRDQLLLQNRQDVEQTTSQENIYQERDTSTFQATRTPSSQEPEERKRNRWWWPFAAGNAAARIENSQNLDEQNQINTLNQTQLNPAIISPTQEELRNLSLAISSLFLSTALVQQSAPLNGSASVRQDNMDDDVSEDIKPTSTQPSEIIRDTVFLENKAIIKMIRSKESIYFKINQREVDSEELKKLADLADFVKENAGASLMLTGFADNTGNVNYNLKLAEDRTKAVAEALIESFGLDPSKIQLESGGQVVRGTQRATNDRDRRVEVKLLFED